MVKYFEKDALGTRLRVPKVDTNMGQACCRGSQDVGSMGRYASNTKKKKMFSLQLGNEMNHSI